MPSFRVSVLVLAAAAFATSMLAAPPKKSTHDLQVEHGRYLVMFGGCNDCHSPKKPMSMEPDQTRMLSGRPATTPAPAKPAHPGEVAASGDLTAWYGPWGVSYSANLTPDPKTGIGKRYTEASFIKTMRTGKKPEGEDLLPPMPWLNLSGLTDADLKAIFAFLQTVKPVENNVKAAMPAKK